MIEQSYIFPILLTKIKTKDWVSKKRKLLSLIDWEDPKFCYDQQITDYFEYAKGTPPYIEEFCSILSEELDLLLKVSECSRLDIRNLWGQRYTKGNYMPSHNHGALGYSAVLYVDFNKKEHPPIRFLSSTNDVYGTMQEFTPEIEEGNIFIFPSHLFHDVAHCKSDKQRTIYSFNFTTTS